MPASIQWNRKPLPKNTLAPLAPSAIRPEGWLREAVEQDTAAGPYADLLRACLLDDTHAKADVQAQARALMQKDARLENDEIRALLAYHAETADKEAVVSALRQVKALRDRLASGHALAPEQAANLGDWMHLSLWLYNLTGIKSLLDFCRTLKAQAPDWMSTLHICAQKRPVQEAPDHETDAYYRVHGPTIAAAMKTPGLQALFEGGKKNEEAFRVGFEKLMRYHGAAHGLFNADPLLAGANPSCGLDPAVVEEMLRSAQVQLWALGDTWAGDLLEAVAMGPAMCASYVQAANELVAADARPRGVAQYAASLWMATADEGLAAIGYAPSTVRWRVGGALVRIRTQTAYPAQEALRLSIDMKEAAAFALRLRIPGWAQDATVAVNDEAHTPCAAGGFHRLERVWQGGDVVTLRLPMQVRTERWYHQSLSVACGPLTYALAAEEAGAWRVALDDRAGFGRGEVRGIPAIHAQGAEVPDWLGADRPAAPPVQPQTGAARAVTLYPYGRTAPRITQFPCVSAQNQQQEGAEKNETGDDVHAADMPLLPTGDAMDG